MGFILQRAYQKDGRYTEIAHYRTCEALIGAYNSSQHHEYSYTDNNVYNGITYWYKLIDVDIYGNLTEKAMAFATPYVKKSGVKDQATASIPHAYFLDQNAPNPFNPNTVIRVDIPESIQGQDLINLSVYNLTGQKIKSLVDTRLPAGSHFISWNGTNENGQKVPSGIYVYILDCGGFYAAKKMMLVR